MVIPHAQHERGERGGGGGGGKVIGVGVHIYKFVGQLYFSD